MKYKLIFGVRDVTAGGGEPRPADGFEAPAFYDVHELSQIVIDVNPDDLERYVQKAKAILPDASAELDVMKRAYVRDLAEAACDIMLRGMAEKIAAHSTREAAL